MDKNKQGTETTALAVTLANDKALGDVFVESGFFSDAKGQSQAVVKILAGREIGLQPIESMTGIHIIKGKISLGANAMASAVKKNPDYDYKVTEHSAKECIIEFYQKGEKIGTSSFTMEDAKKAGVMISGGSWYKWPKAMLFARAISAGVRYYCPDVFGYAPVYVPEEMGEAVNEEGEPLNVTPMPEVVLDGPQGEDVKTLEPEFKKVPEDEDPEPEKEEDSEFECTCPADCLVHEKEDQEDEDPEPEDEASEETPHMGLMKCIDESMTPRDALTAIMDYATEKSLGSMVRPVIVKHYPKFEDGSIYPYHIPESKVIKIVEDLTSMTLKKAEKSKKCKKKECGKRVTEPEAEEQDDLCLKCWQKEND